MSSIAVSLDIILKGSSKYLNNNNLFVILKFFFLVLVPPHHTVLNTIYGFSTFHNQLNIAVLTKIDLKTFFTMSGF